MANNLIDINPQTGEIEDQGQSLALQMHSKEIDLQISTAKRFPRNVVAVSNNIFAMATRTESAAASMTYLLPRKDKNGREVKIEGPSIRFAEVLAATWGNLRTSATVVEVNKKEGYLTAEAIFHDLETNSATKKSVRRNIRTKSGGVYGEDMIQQTGNAACSIALRNSILGGIPQAIWRDAWEASQEVLRGDESKRIGGIAKMLAAFQSGFGVPAASILAHVKVAQQDEITLDQLADLRKMFGTLKNGESTVREMFPTGEPEHEVIADPLKDDAEALAEATKDKPKGKGRTAPAKTQKFDDDLGEVDENGDPL